jgi:hypothetical protein
MRAPLKVACAGVLAFTGLFVFGANSACAQGSLYSGGGTSYVPFGSGGGFVPYRSGPSGGFGLQPSMSEPPLRTITTPPGMSGGMRSDLGNLRGTLTPLRPLGLISGGGSGTMGMGVGRSGRRTPARPGVMGGMARPPVGSYPFRVPPSLVGPGSAPGMSM